MLNVVYVINLYDEFDNVVSTSRWFDDMPNNGLVEEYMKIQNDEDVVFKYAAIEKRYYNKKKQIKEEIRDLFLVDRKEYVLAHYISLDCAMGAGVAEIFADIHKGIKDYCKKQVFLGIDTGDAIRYEDDLGVVYNLITKSVCWHKANESEKAYEMYLYNLENCLDDLKYQMMENNERKLAIPQLGSGLDKCNYSDVKEIIEKVFNGSNIEVLICSLE